jgi:hypothetical protein
MRHIVVATMKDSGKRYAVAVANCSRFLSLMPSCCAARFRLNQAVLQGRDLERNQIIYISDTNEQAETSRFNFSVEPSTF